MTICALPDLPALLPDRGRLIGIDVGARTLGLALSDPTRTVATPLHTIRRSKFSADWTALAAVLDEHDIAGLVIGLPVNMDGSEGPRAQSTRQFARNILARRDLPVAFWDERWSTQAVTRTLLDADASRKRRGEVIDKMAAAYILQGALDSLRNRG